MEMITVQHVMLTTSVGLVSYILLRHDRIEFLIIHSISTSLLLT